MRNKLWNVIYWIFIVSALALSLGLTAIMVASEFGFIKVGII